MDAALSAALNGGYQGIILTAVVWLGLKCLPGVNAATRYVVWLGVLVLVAALPVLALRGRIRRRSGRGTSLTQTARCRDQFRAGGVEDPGSLRRSGREEEAAKRAGNRTELRPLLLSPLCTLAPRAD